MEKHQARNLAPERLSLGAALETRRSEVTRPLTPGGRLARTPSPSIFLSSTTKWSDDGWVQAQPRHISTITVHKLSDLLDGKLAYA